MENNINYRSTRANKAPVYTSDKRAKFTQRANKKWVRLATVFGYMIAVSMPAVVLSVYYTCFWDPNYATLFNKTEKNSPQRHRRHLETRKLSQNEGQRFFDPAVRPIAAPPTVAPTDQFLTPKSKEAGSQCLPCVCNSQKINNEDSDESEIGRQPKLSDVITGDYYTDSNVDSEELSTSAKRHSANLRTTKLPKP